MRRRVKRRLLVCLTAGVLIAAQGCSTLAYFVVVNYATESITIRYAVDAAKLWPERHGQACLLAPPYLHAPPVFDATNVKVDAILKTVGPAAEEYSLDEESCTIELQLAPDHGVVIWKLLNYDADTRSSSSRGFITYLELSGRGSTVEYEGRDLRQHFEKRSKSLYAMSYPGGDD